MLNYTQGLSVITAVICSPHFGIKCQNVLEVNWQLLRDFISDIERDQRGAVHSRLSAVFVTVLLPLFLLQLREELSSIVYVYRFLRWLSDSLKGQKEIIIMSKEFKCCSIKNVHFHFYLCMFLRLGSNRFGNTPDVLLDFCEDLIEVLHLLIFHSIDLWSHKLCLSRCNKHHIQETVSNMEEKGVSGNRYYVFECCRDRFRFVLVFKVLVCHLKDVLLFFPFLFILRHVTWGENTNQLGYIQQRVIISTPLFISKSHSFSQSLRLSHGLQILYK